MPLSSLSDREREIRQRLKDDLEHYAPRCLKIRSKSGKVVPFEFNRAQKYVHARIEEQRAKTGKVRALVTKGRQQGISTYIAARFYHNTTHHFGVKCFILTHEQSATDNLFAMVERYHEHCPPLVRPTTGASNAKELSFSKLDSGYAVGTAGSKAVGRSSTIQLMHGSEVAYWPNAETHFAGVVQAVPDMEGTEILLESTANGIGGEFHERWQMAERGQSDYIAIFVPWFWQEEYTRIVDHSFELTEEEREYQHLYGLTAGQMAWRRAKISELKDPTLFKQEYPATAAEAFQASGHDSYITPDQVNKARKNTVDPLGPLVIGADPARFGDDRFALAFRQGRKLIKIESREKLDVVQGANWIKQVIDAEKPERVFIDVGGLGAGTYDILASWGGVYRKVCVPINFGSAPQDDVVTLPDGTKRPGAKNRRAEMWMRSKEWLDDVAGVDIPDSDTLHADACGPGYKYDANQRLELERKEDMRKRGVRSPDEWDAVALTFAEPVAPAYVPVKKPARDWVL
jgi:hypothetical protein